MWLLSARAPPAAGASRVTLANRRFVSSVSVHRRRGTALVRCHADSDKPLGSAAVAEEAEKTFIDELRSYAMRLHTKEQAPKEGQVESPKEKEPWKPTREGYLQFLLESREVYRAFEAITHSGAASFDGKFVNTGLERTSALDADIEYMQEHFEMSPQVTLVDGPGQSYARFLHELSSSSPPAFLCHYYNFYFAHTAGGRMIGAQVSKSVLDGWMGEFYKWDGDVRKLLDSVRGSINNVAYGWSEEEKQACIEETPRTFEYSGKLLRCLTSEGVKM